MKIQETTIVVGFYTYSEVAGKKLDGTLFLNINPKETKWFDEAKRVLIQKGYVDESYHFEEENYPYDGGDFYQLVSDDYDKASIELYPFWITGEILTNE